MVVEWCGGLAKFHQSILTRLMMMDDERRVMINGDGKTMMKKKKMVDIAVMMTLPL